MVYLVPGIDNRVMLDVSTFEPKDGWTATLYALGTQKTISELSENGDYVTFTVSEISEFVRSGGNSYGTLVIEDSDGDVRYNAMIEFKRANGMDSTVAASQKVRIDIPRKMIPPSGGGGGGGDTPDLSNYATKIDLNKAKKECKDYADDKDSQAATIIISEQPVTVVTDPETHTEKQVTVAEICQQTVSMSTVVKKLEASQLVGSIEDGNEDGQPDDETLYFKSGKVG